MGLPTTTNPGASQVTNNVITCRTMEQFLAVIGGLVERGLTFKADADCLTVTLTGGY